MKSKVFNVIKKAVASVVFLSILFTVLIQLSYLFRYKETDKSVSIINNFYAEEENTIDVAMIGSSATYRYYIPALMYHETGLTYTMFAYSTMPFEAVKYAIDEVEKTQHPKLYLIELRRFYHNFYYEEIGKLENQHVINTYKSGISGLLSCMPVSLNRAAIIKNTVSKYLHEDELDWQFEYMRTHNNWKNLSVTDVVNYLNKYFLKKDEVKQKNKDKYKISRSVTTANPIAEPDLASYSAVRTISEKEFEPLDELLEYIQKHDLNVLFISTPYPITEVAYAYEQCAENYLVERGIPYLNCNKLYDEIGMDFSTDFYDDRHCNLSGAIKFTKFISSYITDTLGIKPDELSGELKDEWDTAYNLWYKDKAVPGLEKLKAAPMDQ